MLIVATSKRRRSFAWVGKWKEEETTVMKCKKIENQVKPGSYGSFQGYLWNNLYTECNCVQ